MPLNKTTILLLLSLCCMLGSCRHAGRGKDDVIWQNLQYIRTYEEKNAALPTDSVNVRETVNHFLLTGESLEKAYANFYLGRLYASSGEDNDALKHYFKALELARTEQESGLAGRICRYMGEIYWKDEDYRKYINISKEGIRFFGQAGDTKGQILLYKDIANGFLHGSSSDSALVYCREGEILARKINDREGILRICYELGYIYWVRKEYDMADIYLRKALELTKDSLMRQEQQQLLVSVCVGEGKYGEAKELLIPFLHNRGLTLEEKTGSYYRMYQIEFALKNYENALDWYKRFNACDDSIRNQRRKIDTGKVEIAGKLEKLSNSNRLLKAASISGLLLLLILAVTAFYYYRANGRLLKKNLAVGKENEILRDQHVHLHEELLEKSDFVQKASLLLKTPSHKRKELETKMQEVFKSSQLTNEDWEDMEDLINKSQNNAAKKIRERYTGILTEDELRTLLLIKEEVSNSKLAMLFNIRIESVMTKRYRIRKKIGVPKDITLQDFINPD